MNITIDYNYIAIFLMNLLYLYIVARTIMFLLWFIFEIIFRDEDYPTFHWNNAPFIWNIIRLTKEGKEAELKEKQEEEKWKLKAKQHQDEYQAKMNKVIEQRIAEYEKSKKVEK